MAYDPPLLAAFMRRDDKNRAFRFVHNSFADTTQ
jgi:hypothetical protein